MKFTALQNSSAVLAVLVASSAFATMTTLTASNITGTGLYAQSPTTWSIQFIFNGALSQSALDGEFGNWMLVVTGSTGESWSNFNSVTSGGAFINYGSTRTYTVEIGSGDGGTQGTPGLTPTPSFLSMDYTTGGAWTLGEALDYSALSGLAPDDQKGRLSVTHVNAETGMVDGEISGIFSVPTPGAVALIGLAGMVAGRRRRN